MCCTPPSRRDHVLGASCMPAPFACTARVEKYSSATVLYSTQYSTKRAVLGLAREGALVPSQLGHGDDREIIRSLGAVYCQRMKKIQKSKLPGKILMTERTGGPGRLTRIVLFDKFCFLFFICVCPPAPIAPTVPGINSQYF